jgi:hypothetical protein
MTEAIVAVSEVSEKSPALKGVGQFYETLFGNFKPDNQIASYAVEQANDVFDQMRQSGLHNNPMMVELTDGDKGQTDYLRMSDSIRNQMVDGMQDVFEKRTDEAVGMYKTGFITKVFSKAVQGMTQLVQAQ